ncbi:MAG: hypothetical protein ACTSU5_00785 [Promethearchaeota archaeon]
MPEGISIRESTELRQDTTEKSREALLRRIKYFEERRDFPLQDKIEDAVANVITGLATVENAIEKAIPEDLRKKALELYEKLLLAF